MNEEIVAQLNTLAPKQKGEKKTLLLVHMD
jgi:hypothetical protein